MRGKAVKKVSKLVLNKDPNLLESIKKRRGNSFAMMSGVAIYRYAKRVYHECCITNKEKWGI